MDFKKSKVLLKKINAIYESGEAFNHEFSALEKDLLLQYLREFYECIAAAGTESKSNLDRPSQSAHTTVSTPVAPAPKVVADTIQVQPEPEPVAVHSNGQQKASAPQKPAATPVVESVEVSEDADVSALFEQEALNDLSNRFANSPITDIAKAMGINERILTINELFGGDQQAFLSIVGRLNNADNFDAAKDILKNDVVNRFNWTKGSRSKKAKIFVQLVRRRFL